MLREVYNYRSWNLQTHGVVVVDDSGSDNLDAGMLRDADT